MDEQPKEYEVTLQYFKKSGKYYTEGKYMTTKEWMFHIVDEVKAMRDAKTLPGIGGSEWIIHVSSESHPNNFPCLILNNTGELRLDAEEAKLIYLLIEHKQANYINGLDPAETDLMKKVSKFTAGKW